MSSIDKRIVEMQFINRDFENGVKTTMASLKELNKTLNTKTSAKGLEDIDKGANKASSTLKKLAETLKTNIGEKAFSGFKSGAEKAMSVIKKLSEAMRFKNAGKGLNDIDKEIKSLSTSGLGGLSQGVEALTNRFSTMGVIATTALANITNSAINTGKKLVNDLAIEPVTSGFSEYETKINAIQTILTNTAHLGTTLDDVTKALNELNKYSDDTIYNFAEMAKNIGTFTAAGIDLETSTSAIKGIANLAAASGSTPQQAASAMYQLSQALAAGKVTMMDWNSVINAGMGGKLFQDALIRTSEVMGTGAEAAIKKFGSFKESLTQGEWLTTDVLVETLNQLAGAYSEADLVGKGFTRSQAKEILALAENATKAATEVKTVTGMLDALKESQQSGWATSWEYIIGNKEQATETLTAVKDKLEALMAPAADARNEMLSIWNMGGGRDAVIKGIGTAFDSLVKGLSAVKQGFRDVFPAMTGERLIEISKGFQQLTEKFKMSDETASKIRDTFKGLFSVFKLLGDAAKTVFSSLSPLGDIFLTVADGILSATSTIGKFISGIADAADRSKFFENIANGVKNAFSGMGNFISNVKDTISNLFSYLSNINFGDLFSFIGDIVSKFGSGIGDILSGIGKALGTINFNAIFAAINTALAGGLVKTFKSVVDGINDGIDSIKDTFGTIKGAFSTFKDSMKSVSEVLDSVREALQAYQNNLNADTLLKLGKGIALLAASIFILSTIDMESMSGALIGMGALFVEFITGVQVLFKGLALIAKDKVGLKSVYTMTSIIKSLAKAILTLSIALKIIATLDLEELGVGLLGVAGLMTMMVLAVKHLKTEEKHLMSIAMSLTVFATALNILARAVKNLGKLETETLCKGLISIGVLIAELVIFMRTLDGSLSLQSAAGILVLAGALNVLALAVSLFGNMDTENLVKGLASVGIALCEIGIFSEMMKDNTGMLKTAAALTVMAAALMALSVAVKMFGSMEWETIGTGIFAIAAALVVLDVAVTTMQDAKMLQVAVGIAAMSASLLILNTALNGFGSMSWEEIAKGMVTMAGSLTILALAMKGMSTGLAGAAAMLVMSAALAIFTPQLIALSQLDPTALAIGLLAIGGALAVIGVAAVALTPALPAIIGLAAAIALFGAGAALAGAGLALVGSGLAAIVAALSTGGLLMIEILRQAINLLPQFGTKLGEGFVNLAEAIGNGIPQIMEAINKMITGILDSITNNLPQIATSAVNLITTLAETLLTNADKLITVGIQLVIKLVDGLYRNMETLIQAAIDLAVKFMNSLADGLRTNIPAIESAVKNLGSAIVETLYAILPDWLKAGIEWVGELINGMGQKEGDTETQGGKISDAAKNGLKKNDGEFKPIGAGFIDKLIAGITGKNGAANSAGGKAADAARNGAKSKEGQFQPLGSGFINKMISGIKGMFGGARSAGTGAANSAKSGAQSGSSGFSSIGRSMVQGMISGMGGLAGALYEKARGIAKKAYEAAKNALQINSPSKLFMRLGSGTIEGFVKGISDNMSDVVKSSEGISNSAYKAVSRTIGAVTEAMNTNIDMNPTITPVLDLTNIQNGSRTIGSLLGSGNGLTLSADASGAISRTIGTIQNGTNNNDIIDAIKDLNKEMKNINNTTYTINGITYDDGTNVSNAIETLVRAARIERRI